MVILRSKKLKLSDQDFYTGMFRHIMYMSYLRQNIKTDFSGMGVFLWITYGSSIPDYGFVFLKLNKSF